MNVNVFCYLKSQTNNNSNFHTDIVQNNTIVSCRNGPSCKFDEVFRDMDDIMKIQNICLRPLVNATINGWNTCLLLFGESESGKSNIIWGNDINRTGLFSFTVNEIFDNLEIDERFRSSFKVRMRIFNVHENTIVDLIRINNPSRLNADKIEYSINTGNDIKELTDIELTSGAQAMAIFTDAWNQRISLEREDTYLQGSVMIQIKLILKNFEDRQKNTVSQLTFVYFPGEESSFDSQFNRGRQINSPGLSSLQRLLTKLSERDISYVNYGESVLTRLLEDEIGGNCMTNAILFVPPYPNINVFVSQITMMDNLTKVQNCPIINTDLARRLLYNLRQQRKELVLEINPDNKMQPNQIRLNKLSLMENIKLTQKENVTLRDKVEDLQSRLERIHERYDNMMRDITYKNDDFIQVEEGKLRSSKRIIDLEILNNKLKEQLERIRFELQSRIAHLEEELNKNEIERQVYSLQSREFEKLKLEKDQLVNQLAVLQKNSVILQNKLRFMNSRNDELSLEFVNFSNSKANTDSNNRQGGIIGLPIMQAPRDTGQSKPYSEMKISPVIQVNDDNLKLKIGQLQNELHKSRQITQEKILQYSKTTAELHVIREENKDLKSQVEYFSKYMSTIGQNYQDQLKKNTTNIVNLMNSGSNNASSYKDEFQRLLKRYDESHLLREIRLKETIDYLTVKEDKLKSWGEKILLEYIKVREQLLKSNTTGIDVGPDPKDILWNHPFPNEKVKSLGSYLNNKGSRENDPSKIMELQQQVKEFKNNTVTNLEVERAKLLSKNVELEERLLAAQHYIDFNLKEKSTQLSMIKKPFN